MLPRQARDKTKKAEKKAFAAGIVIRSNVLTRCTDSAGLVAEPGVQLVNIQNNNIWLTGKGGGLKELTQPRLSQQLRQPPSSQPDSQP